MFVWKQPQRPGFVSLPRARTLFSRAYVDSMPETTHARPTTWRGRTLPTWSTWESCVSYFCILQPNLSHRGKNWSLSLVTSCCSWQKAWRRPALVAPVKAIRVGVGVFKNWVYVESSVMFLLTFSGIEGDFYHIRQNSAQINTTVWNRCLYFYSILYN